MTGILEIQEIHSGIFHLRLPRMVGSITLAFLHSSVPDIFLALPCPIFPAKEIPSMGLQIRGGIQRFHDSAFHIQGEPFQLPPSLSFSLLNTSNDYHRRHRESTPLRNSILAADKPAQPVFPFNGRPHSRRCVRGFSLTLAANNSPSIDVCLGSSLIEPFLFTFL